MSVCSTDLDFFDKWETLDEFLDDSKPELIILNVGADSIKGDPLTNMMLSPESYIRVTTDLINIVMESC